MNRPIPSFWNFLFVRNSILNNMSFALGISIVTITIYGVALQESFFVQELIYNLAFGLMFIALGFIPARKEFLQLTSVYETGIETSGVIVDLFVKWWGGYVTYEYSFMDKKIRSTERINRTWKTKTLQIGQKVWLYVNKQKPEQAFIRDLYL
ncbi:MAG: hypothetical protein HY867_15780 [Chloroflexi bacterium]|nr:hypothetical protein [Chloroflexota bacterium]